MDRVAKFALGCCLLAGCSSGSVYFGEGNTDTAISQHGSSGLGLTEILPQISPTTHEYFIEEGASPRSFMAVPRSLDAQLYVMTTSDIVNEGNLAYGNFTLWTNCYEVVGYKISEVPSDESPTLKLERTPEYRNGICQPHELLSLQGFQDKAELTEDLKNNTAQLDTPGFPRFRKVSTINRGWEPLSKTDAPPKLAVPVGYPTEHGFLLWGKNIDSETMYASLYNHDDKTWKALFGLENAPTSDSILTQTWSEGVLYVVAKSGLYLFDTNTAAWLAPEEGATSIWPEDITGAWAVKGDDTFLFIGRTGPRDGEQIDNFYLFSSAQGWRQTLSMPANADYGQPVWDGKAYVLWYPTSAITDFLYPERPDELVTIPGVDRADSEFYNVRRIGRETVRTRTAFDDDQPSGSARLARNHGGWNEADYPLPMRSGSVFAKALSGDWHVSYGAVGQELELDNAAYFYNSDWSHIVRMPASDEIEPTIVPAVAWSHNRLFVWGGCEQLTDLQCVSHSSTGYVLNTFIRP